MVSLALIDCLIDRRLYLPDYVVTCSLGAAPSSLGRTFSSIEY